MITIFRHSKSWEAQWRHFGASHTFWKASIDLVKKICPGSGTKDCDHVVAAFTLPLRKLKSSQHLEITVMNGICIYFLMHLA